MYQNLIIDIKELISCNKLQKSIEKLISMTKGKQIDFYNEVILQAGKLKKLETEKIKGIITRECYNIEEARIADNLLTLTDKLDNYEKINNNGLLVDPQKVEIIIEGDIDDFNLTRRENLIDTVAAILKIDKESVKIKKVVEGSIKVIIEIPKNKAKLLGKLVSCDEKTINLLKKENVKSVKIATGNFKQAKNLFESEKELVEKIKAGDEKTLFKFYTDNFKLVTNHLTTAYGLSKLDTEEIYQRSILSLYQNVRKDKFQLKSSLKSYLIMIARRYSSDLLRKNMQFEHFLADYPAAETQGFSDVLNDNFSILEKAMNSLGKNCKEVLELRYLHGMKYKDIANELGISEASIKVTVSRCLSNLRKTIENDIKIRENKKKD